MIALIFLVILIILAILYISSKKEAYKMENPSKDQKSKLNRLKGTAEQRALS